jgi:NodT family efflux transporter outer membrane factor (OMF) lipoprotein
LLHPEARLCHAVAATLATALLAGCAIPHDKPKVRVLESAAVGLHGPATIPTAGWWQRLNDPQLDRIMDDALAGNPTLDVAMARLRLARAGVETQRAGLLPTLDFDASEERSQLSGAYEIPQAYAGSVRWIGSIQTSLSWTFDFAGKQRALISQSRHWADAASLDVAAARLTLTGAVAEAYVGLARAELQMRIAQAFVTSRRDSLALARTRANNDLDDEFDIRAAETLLAEAQKSFDQAKGDRDLMVHALAALAGRGADAYSALTPPTLSLDAALSLPASLPANLLDRRPDILAARARIYAANAGRKAAVADFYPSIDLHAFQGLSSVDTSKMLTERALTWGVGPALHVPLFEGGRLGAQYKAATAEIDVAAASYNETILDAVKQAADALSSIDSTAAQAADQRDIQRGLAETVRLDRVRVRTGLGTQLDILASGDRLLQAQQTQADLDAEGLTRRVELLIAVGGDFDPKTPIAIAAADRGASPKARP